ncbi:MAG: DNA-3-methyladenine glycosylase [Ignavibacteriaceae bacterium]|nr:DNA-3-methyladenine glycosylase [Ignavibacteriaceae bacterium]
MNSLEIRNGINHLIDMDPVLRRIISQTQTCRIKRRKNYYPSLVKAIINQQLSVKAGESIYKKFSAHFGKSVKPENVAATPVEEIRKFGLSNAKAIYVKDLSEKIMSNQLSFKKISQKSNDEIIGELTKVKGIGVWTAHMFLIFTLGRLDVLPVGDLGIKNAIRRNYQLKELPDENKIAALCEKKKWKPYQSIASWYLWMSLEL